MNSAPSQAKQIFLDAIKRQPWTMSLQMTWGIPTPAQN